MLDFIIISGPTGVGKTSFTEKLAQKLDAEVISADSQAVYKGFDIGTAKPKKDTSIKYHLIDIKDAKNGYDVSEFLNDVETAIKEIWSRNKKIVITGGTPMYINRLIYGMFEGPKRNEEIRKRLEEEGEKKGFAFLYERLKKVDPIQSEKIHPNDKYRIIRALEVYESTGVPISKWQKKNKNAKYRYLYFIFTRERAHLYERINKRVELMLEEGWIDEVKGLLKQGLTGDEKPFQSLGYKEIMEYLKGDITYDEMVHKIKRNTRHFARRQLIWFRKEKNTIWYNLDNIDEDGVLEDMVKLIEKNGGLK